MGRRGFEWVEGKILRATNATVVQQREDGGAPRATSAYTWGDKTLRFVRCSKCGCLTHLEPVHCKAGSRMGVNMRNFEPSTLGPVRIRHLDGAHTWKYVDSAVRK